MLYSLTLGIIALVPDIVKYSQVVILEVKIDLQRPNYL